MDSNELMQQLDKVRSVAAAIEPFGISILSVNVTAIHAIGLNMDPQAWLDLVAAFPLTVTAPVDNGNVYADGFIAGFDVHAYTAQRDVDRILNGSAAQSSMADRVLASVGRES